MKYVEDLNTEFAKGLHGIKLWWIHCGDTLGFSCGQKFVNFRPLLRFKKKKFFFFKWSLISQVFTALICSWVGGVCWFWVGFCLGLFSFFNQMLCCFTLSTPTFRSIISIMALICPTGVYSGIRCVEMYYQCVIIKSTTWSQLDFFLISGCALAAECAIVVGCSSCCWCCYTSLGALSASLCSASFSFQKCKIEVVVKGRGNGENLQGFLLMLN